MRLGSIISMRLRTLFWRRRVEQELDEELRYHLDRQIDENIANGMSQREARWEALKEFAEFEQRKEECRDMRGWNVIDNLVQDLRFALRQLGKSPGFTATAILLPALGLCASVAIFAFVDAALIKPLPYANPSRLLGVYETSGPQCLRCNLSYLDYLDWKKMNTVFSSLDAYKNAGFIVTTAMGAQPAPAARVTAGFFRTLGIAPMLGRDFHEGEDLAGAARTILLTYAAWRGRYGGDPRIIGRGVTLDGEGYEVIGVLPKEFQFAPTGRAEYYAPMNPNGGCERRRGCHNLYGVGRLKDGASLEAASAETMAIAKQLEKQYPDTNRDQGAKIVQLSEVIVGDVRPILLVLISGAGLLLFIAFINVASLLLVRSEGRRRELSVRSALGASRLRLMRQFVTEGMVLVGAGSFLGLIGAAWAMQLLVRLIPTPMMARLPFLQGLGVNFRVWIFAAIITLFAAAVFSFTPALGLRFSEMRQGLAEGSRGSAGTAWRRLGSKLVMVELATAMVLLVGAGLLGQSLYRLLRVDLGFQADRLAAVDVMMPDSAYGEASKAVAMTRQIRSRIESLPGVEAVGNTSVLPVSYNGNTTWVRFAGKPYNGEHNDVLFREVSAGYFKTIKARLISGRYFNESEDASKPNVAIINQTFARMYFPGEDPIGKKYGNTTLAPESMREVVGVIADVREGPLDGEIRAAEYRPYNQGSDTSFSLIVRTAQDPGSLLPAMGSAIRELDRGIVTIDGVVIWDRIEDSSSAYMRRSATWLVGAFAALALLLGVVGLYGVIAYSVSQRTREIGVRMALGAERHMVYELIMREAGWLAAIGIVAGVLGSLAGTRLLRKILFGIQSWDVPTLLTVAAVLAVAAMTASFIPARRAASVNPVDALRSE